MDLKRRIENLRKRFDAWCVANRDKVESGPTKADVDDLEAELVNAATALDIERVEVANECLEDAERIARKLGILDPA